MLSASFFSLISPAIQHSTTIGLHPILPLCIGFVLGIGFIKLLERVVPRRLTCCTALFKRNSQGNDDILELEEYSQEDEEIAENVPTEQVETVKTCFGKIPMNILLLVIAVTVHNIPEGLVIGFGYGAANQKTYEINDALLLTAAISLQNIPEGMALAVPLHKSGLTKFKSFMIAQLSGLIEVIAALIGVSFVVFVKSLLPYALSFASGAMVYVVFAELLPMSYKSNKKWGIWGSLVGFTVMMLLDVGFGH